MSIDPIQYNACSYWSNEKHASGTVYTVMTSKQKQKDHSFFHEWIEYTQWSLDQTGQNNEEN